MFLSIFCKTPCYIYSCHNTSTRKKISINLTSHNTHALAINYSSVHVQECPAHGAGHTIPAYS